MISFVYGLAGVFVGYASLVVMYYVVFCIRQDGKPKHWAGFVAIVVWMIMMVCIAAIQYWGTNV